MISAGDKVYFKAYGTALRPEPSLTVSDWADRYRILDSSASSESGRWRTSRTPYLKEIMDCLSVSEILVQTVVFMKGAQIGATEAGNNWLGYVIHHAPSPLLYVMPTSEMVKRASKQRIAPLLEATPELKERISSPRSRDSGNTIMMKEFDGGALVMTGANSAVGLRSMPARYLFLDEIDAYPGDLDGEGDPISLAMKRTSTFKRNRKVFMPSTPTLKGLSHIERLFEQSDKRYYFVPCPVCNSYQRITWDKMHWEDAAPHLVHMTCESCGHLIPESAKTDMLAKGEWRSTAVSTDLTLRGYHLSALYSPLGWYGWGEAVKEFLLAKDDPSSMKTWINTVLGETYEEGAELVDVSTLLARLQPFTSDQARVRTIGVDVQKDRLEFTVIDWGYEEEAWVYEHVIIPGDTATPDPWGLLDLELEAYSPHCVAIDSGYNTSMVEAFVANKRFCYAVKGISGTARPIVEDAIRRRQRLRLRNKKVIPKEPIGVDQAKSIIYARLKKTNPGPGYIHFRQTPSFDKEYFDQLAAETINTKKVAGRIHTQWVQLRNRNEALDCMVYALAAVRLSGVSLVPREVKPESKKVPERSKNPISSSYLL